ncbi:general secretion pathway protein H [Thalassoporum mexicanum PCC 7367]|uniref:type IV pilin-like G/H family protein n=1 Tax=Thalassoporum mexicanum TaxID=3457544 RepID=UPI00029FD525|nr:type IV pilin-like G/H family protein [Pseudanabaena sp. PCC 7367]AFY70322.1 general secretion pathway protein H [Pseudanabaena sp. PCC 7367]
MKFELKYKLVEYLLNRQNNSWSESHGFTLIELLVVIVIIGILAAISLPTFLNQASKARHSEAKTYVSAMNRAQQTYFIEKQQFACNADIGFLGLGIPANTPNFNYEIAPGTNCIGVTGITNRARPLPTRPLKAHLGGVSISNSSAILEATALSTLCEADQIASIAGAPQGTETMNYSTGAAPSCPANYLAIN